MTTPERTLIQVIDLIFIKHVFDILLFMPWRCHRSLIADALTVRNIRTEDIMSPTRRQMHILTAFAKACGTTVTYQAQDSQIPQRKPVKRLPSCTRHFTPVGLLIAKTETFSRRSAIAARFVLFGVSACWLSLSTRTLSQIRLYFDNKIVRFLRLPSGLRAISSLNLLVLRFFNTPCGPDTTTEGLPKQMVAAHRPRSVR
jgi:hypothetical protein